MDLDFLLTTVIYLVVLLFTHQFLKNNEINNPTYIDTTEIDFVIPKKNHNTQNNESQQLENSNQNTIENTSQSNEQNINNLIINQSEIDNIDNNSTDQFLKYLNLEENEKNENVQLITKEINTDNLVKNGINDTLLGKYFDNSHLDENSGDLVFEPVPTKNEDTSSNGLFADIKKLNDENVYDNVYAFDDFNCQYAPL
uniref:Uncharacterized protein n=1 Tax=viral metagenome TaxID=1070528 RepID=A0A6C0JCG1_9ZZZZ